MTPKLEQLHELHRLYCHLTGFQLSMAFDRERQWYDWSLRFTARDLEDVVRWLRVKIKDGSRNPGALRFRNLIGQLDLFEEDLAMCRAEGRKPQVSARDKALSQLRPQTVQPAPQAAKPIGEYIEKLRRAAQ